MNDYRFGVFILTHKRAHEQLTYKLLTDGHYTGDLFLIVDDKDEDLTEYKEMYGDKVIVFNKEQQYRQTDTCTNRKLMSAAIYARRYCEKIAAQMGYDVFLMLDDDIERFDYRKWDGKKLKCYRVHDIGGMIKVYADFLWSVSIPCISTICDCLMIGASKRNAEIAQRKGFQVFFRRTDMQIDWKGVMSEDMIVSTAGGAINRGIITFPPIQHKCRNTASNKGGME